MQTIEPTTFEAVTRVMVETLAEELRTIHRRVDGLFWMSIGAVVMDTVLRLLGPG
jgi:hypothetical protein